MAPLDEGDAPLGHQSSHVAILHAEAFGDSPIPRSGRRRSSPGETGELVVVIAVTSVGEDEPHPYYGCASTPFVTRRLNFLARV